MADFPDVLHSSLLIICLDRRERTCEYETFAAIDIGSCEVEMKIFRSLPEKESKKSTACAIAWNLAKMYTVMAGLVWR